MSDWRDFEEGRRGVSLSGLSDGETAEFLVDDKPFLKDEEIEQDDGSVDHSESIHVPVIPVDVPDGFVDMNDEQVATVESAADPGDDAPRYDVINSSSSFKNALRNAFPEGVTPVGSVVAVTANQPSNDPTSRYYEVSDATNE